MNNEPNPDRAEPERTVMGLSPMQVAARAIVAALIVIVVVIVISLLSRA
jgi:hypothetical protein